MKNKLLKIITASALLAIVPAITVSCNQPASGEVEPTGPTVKEITIVGSSTILLGESAYMVAKAGDTMLTGVTWSSSNKKVAVIDSATGEVTAISVGTVEITAAKDGFTSAKFTLSVIDLNNKSMTITGATSVNVNDKIQLRAYEGTTLLEGVSWASADNNIATVAKNTGIVTGQSEGVVVITASKEGYNDATFIITVTKSESTVDTYTITFKQSVGIQFNCDKTLAKEGETVTFTITVLNEALVVNKVFFNSTELIPDGEGVYSFVMGNRDAIISVEVSATSPVSIGGEQAIPLVLDDDGIYKALNVPLTQKKQLAFYVENSDHTISQLGYQDVDFDMCNALVKLANDYNSYSFSLPGGASYNFYYNPARAGNRPCYIQRATVDVLPNNVDSVSALIGEGWSFETINPQNVQKVTYSSSKKDMIYNFERFKNDVSYGTVTSLSDGYDLGVYYKELKDGNLKVVDTYKDLDDPTRDRLLSSAPASFSGNFKVYDSDADYEADRWSSVYTTTKREAQYEANHPVKDINSFEMAIYQGYRGGFGTDDGYYTLQSKQDPIIESSRNEDGTFRTSITAWKTYNDSSKETLYQAHIEYTIDFLFKEDGSLITGHYLEKEYGAGSYDFVKDEFLPGGIDTYKVVDDLSISYTYSEELNEAPALDMSKYFISSIDSAWINNKSINQDESKNLLKIGDYIEGDILKLSYTPATALDSWQYTVVESSDTKVITHANRYDVHYAKSLGTANLTLGNPAIEAPRKTVAVEVANTTPIRGVYFDGTAQPQDYVDRPHAEKLVINAGAVSHASLKASPSAATNVGLSFEVNKPELLSVSYDEDTYVFTLDATGAADIVENTTVNIKVTSPYWDQTSVSQYTTLEITIIPHDASPLTINDIAGVWNALSDQEEEGLSDISADDSITFLTTTAANYSGVQYYRAIASNGTESVNFLWGINSKGELVARGDSNTSIDYIAYNKKTEQLGFYMERLVGGGSESWGSWETFLGYQVGDEEYYEIAAEMFVKA